jgi:hypothetical protein
MKCKTCAHPQCQAIDLALLTRTHTLEALSRQYGLTVSSLFRHKQHLVENLDRARDRLSNSQQLGQLLKLNAFLDQVQRAVDAAAADGDVDRVLRGASAGARIIRQMSRMDVPLELDTVYRIISSPQWVTQASLLPTDPRLINDIHQTMADIAFSPCPEPPPELTNDADEDEDDYDSDNEADDYKEEYDDAGEDSATILATGNQQPETISPETQTILRELLANLINAGAIPPEIKREISAKLPKKPLQYNNNNEQYHKYTLCKKNLAQNPYVGRESAADPAGREEITSVTQNKPNYPQPETVTSPPPVYYPEDDCIVPIKNERYYGRGIF